MWLTAWNMEYAKFEYTHSNLFIYSYGYTSALNEFVAIFQMVNDETEQWVQFVVYYRCRCYFHLRGRQRERSRYMEMAKMEKNEKFVFFFFFVFFFCGLQNKQKREMARTTFGNDICECLWMWSVCAECVCGVCACC